MRSQYASTITPPPPTVALASGGTITAAKAGAWSFYLQSRNRAGYTLFSTRVDTTVAAGQKINITIPATCRPNGADLHEVLILASRTTDASTAVVLASYPGYGVDGITPKTLPTTIALTSDEHLELAKTVTTDELLPPAPLNGMRRYVDASASILAYQSSTDTWEKVSPQLFSTYISSTISDNGCDRDLNEITDPSVIITPEYDSTGSVSAPVSYWLTNDESTIIPKGTRVGIAVEIDGEDLSSLFVGLLRITFLGHVSTATGVLDTSGMSVSGYVIYQGAEETDLRLQKDLPIDSAFAITVEAEFRSSYLRNRVLQGSTIGFYPYFYPDFAVLERGGALMGSYILNAQKLRRIVPNGAGLTSLALEGSGQVLLGSVAYSFRDLASQQVFGLLTNTANQKLCITGSGVVFRSPSTTPPEGTAVRAVVGTVDGVGQATAWSNPIALTASTLLQVTIDYPTAIRADYPDIIASSADGEFNATRVRIYVTPAAGGNILEFVETITPGVVSEVFTVGGTTGTNIGTSLPVVAADFGLYKSADNFTTATTVTTTGTLNGSYKVAIAFSYETTITKISHSESDGCILEATETVASLFSVGQSWGASVDTFDDIRGIPELEIYPYQTRRVESENLIYFDAASLAVDNGTSVWRPDWVLASNPGRWILQEMGSSSLVDASKIQGKTVDATAIGNGKVLAYDSITDTIVYVTPSSGSGGGGDGETSADLVYTNANLKGLYEVVFSAKTSMDFVADGVGLTAIIGTDYGATGTYSNPAITSDIQIDATGTNTGNLNNLVDRNDTTAWKSNNTPSPYFVIDLKSHRASISGYSLKSHPSGFDINNFFPKSWKVEGTNTIGTGTVWEIIHEQATGSYFTANNQWFTVNPLTKRSAYYRYIRITQTTPSHEASWCFVLGEVELYGDLIRVTEIEGGSSTLDAHVANTNNPHNVTASQVGAATAQWNANKIQGKTVSAAAIGNGKVLAYNSTTDTIEYITPSGGSGSGEANTASNAGTAGVGFFLVKNGVDLQFKNLAVASSRLSVANNTGNNTVSLDVVEGNLSVTSTINAHIANTSNPHNVTASQVGASTAQWNANQLQGRVLASTAPTTGQVVGWSGIQWEPTTITGGGGSSSFNVDKILLHSDGTIVYDDNYNVLISD